MTATTPDRAGERPMIDTVVLDIDGTLVDTNYQHTLAWARAFAALGRDVPAWRIHRSIGMGGDRLVPRLIGAEADQSIGDDIRWRWEQEVSGLLPETTLLPGAVEFLDLLRAEPYQVVLASSGKPEHVRRALDLLGEGTDPDTAIDEVTSSDDAPTKPAPDLIEKALDAVDGARALVIGDSVWDAEAARHAGARMVGVLSGGFGEAELVRAGAERVVETLRELADGWAEIVATPVGVRAFG